MTTDQPMYRPGRCNRELGDDCRCFRPGGHKGLHQCSCELYGSVHGTRIDMSHSLFGASESKKAAG